MTKIKSCLLPMLLLLFFACRGQEKLEVKKQNESGIKESQTSQNIQLTTRKIVPWKDAKIEYLPDPKGNKFRIIEKNNGLSTRKEGIEYLDASGKVTKTFDLRFAPFAPKYLSAKEKNDETTLRMESTWIESKNLTTTQKREALRPKYATDNNIKKLTSVMTSINIDFDDREDINNMEGYILVEYQTSNYVQGKMSNINSRLVILDSIGNTIDIIDDIPYALNKVVLSSDLRYVCYGYADFMATGDDDEAISPTGIRLYDRKTRKNVIDKYFTPDYSDYNIPTHPAKIGNGIVLAFNGKGLDIAGWTINFVLAFDQNKLFRKDEKIIITSEGYGYGGEIRDIKDSLVTFEKTPTAIESSYNINTDFSRVSFQEFNNLKFKPETK